MQAVKGANRMPMRFDAAPAAARRAVRSSSTAPAWVSGNSARASVETYRFRKRVENLVAPAAYRAVISFRWLRRNGKVARVRRTRPPTCRQPDLRPDLARRS